MAARSTRKVATEVTPETVEAVEVLAAEVEASVTEVPAEVVEVEALTAEATLTEVEAKVARWTLDRESVTALDVDAVEASMTALGTEYAEGDARRANIIVDVAYLTRRAEIAGRIGGDPKSTGVLTSAQWGGMLGVTATNVPKWKTLGYALVDLGVDPASVLYRCLQHRGLAERKVIADAIRAEGQTVEGLAEVVETFVTRDKNGKVTGVLSNAKRDARIASERESEVASDAGTDTGTREAGTGVTVAEVLSTLDNFSAAKMAVEVLRKVTGVNVEGDPLTDDQWDTVAGMLDNLIRRERVIRDARADEAAEAESAA